MTTPATGWARVETGWSLSGLDAVALASDRLRVVVLPGLGGRVWEITDLATGVQPLWHHPRLQPAPVPFGSGYDDNFIGGWDELFPNDLAEELAGEPFPDHGETWSEGWAWRVLPGPDAAVELTLHGRISGCRLRRTLRLAPGSPALACEVEVTNTGRDELPMLHKQHLAVALDAGSRVDLPSGCRVEVGPFGRPRAGAGGDRFAWPGQSDFAAPAPPGTAELLFASDLTQGWCAATRGDGTGIGVAFDAAAYPACWTFASWGGWRGLEVVVLEPCTGLGLSVAEGVETGRHRVLAPGEAFATTVTAVLYSGLARVTSIAGAGDGVRVEGERL
ncbi:hypothetical protein [Micropruina sonneratiae]|uniref:hypothetical protein n=1 Tax=Micropruina sonneratiae TaxID=2986940 RepID=UPI0022260BC3|nr:hypothetical protein [Micropruina sp. KQZ13P-5]MCW3158053.1 hypothetical protein [Micropruina sp. KQZ13P-5]